MTMIPKNYLPEHDRHIFCCAQVAGGIHLVNLACLAQWQRCDIFPILRAFDERGKTGHFVLHPVYICSWSVSLLLLRNPLRIHPCEQACLVHTYINHVYSGEFLSNSTQPVEPSTKFYVYAYCWMTKHNDDVRTMLLISACSCQAFEQSDFNEQPGRPTRLLCRGF